MYLILQVRKQLQIGEDSDGTCPGPSLLALSSLSLCLFSWTRSPEFKSHDVRRFCISGLQFSAGGSILPDFSGLRAEARGHSESTFSVLCRHLGGSLEFAALHTGPGKADELAGELPGPARVGRG